MLLCGQGMCATVEKVCATVERVCVLLWRRYVCYCGEGMCATGCLLDSSHAEFSMCLLCLQIIPEFSTPLMQGTAIFIQSYFDFVRIRNYLKKEDISFCQICELVIVVCAYWFEDIVMAPS